MREGLLCVRVQLVVCIVEVESTIKLGGFRPSRAAYCTDPSEIWREGVHCGSTLASEIWPSVYGTPKILRCYL